MNQVRADPLTDAIILPTPMTDKRWPAEAGWNKMTRNVNKVEIHFVWNSKTGDIDDFKFK